MKHHMNNHNSERGQTLLMILLVMGAALTVGVAVSSRSLGSLDQTVSTTSAVDCLTAAETGVEDALQSLSLDDPSSLSFCDPTSYTNQDWDDPTDGDANIVVCDLDAGNCGGLSEIENEDSDVAYCIWEFDDEYYETDVEQDIVIQVPIRDDIASPVESFDIHWKSADAGSNNAVLVTSQVGYDTSTGEVDALPGYSVDPLVGDGCDVESSSWTGPVPSSTRITGGSMINHYVGPVFPSLWASDHIDLRLRFMCADVEEVIIEGLNSGGTHEALPAHSYKVRSQCLNKPTAKEIEVEKSPPTVPAIFDFGLFSGSSSVPLD